MVPFSVRWQLCRLLKKVLVLVQDLLKLLKPETCWLLMQSCCCCCSCWGKFDHFDLWTKSIHGMN